MIITLSGKVTHKNDEYAVIDVNGVGYQVSMNKPTLAALSVGASAKVWTHEYLREDARELYGFSTVEEHRMFRRLLAVSGVGPKIGLALLTLGSAKEIEKKIESGDIGWLTSVSGVGKKTAQKIILELKGRLVGETPADAAGEEVLAALVNLGYSRERAREILSRVPATEGAPVEDRLRAALRELGR